MRFSPKSFLKLSAFIVKKLKFSIKIILSYLTSFYLHTHNNLNNFGRPHVFGFKIKVKVSSIRHTYKNKQHLPFDNFILRERIRCIYLQFTALYCLGRLVPLRVATVLSVNWSEQSWHWTLQKSALCIDILLARRFTCRYWCVYSGWNHGDLNKFAITTLQKT